MNDETIDPSTGVRPTAPPGKPHLAVVNGTNIVTGRRTRAQTLASRTAPNADPLPPFDDLSDVEGTWYEDLVWTKVDGRKTKEPKYIPANNGANAITILSKDPRWKGVLAYDEFAECVVSTRMPPWHRTDRAGATVGDWTEEDITRTDSWLLRAYGLKLSDAKILSAVSVVAQANRVHPVRAYLEGLEWDEIPRIGTWLITLLGAEDTPYNRSIGKAWLIGAVARIYRPGCKMDNMLILEGETGIRKSSALRALAGDAWFTEISSAIDPVATPQLLRRKWIVELGELAALRRTRDQETIKSFLSRQTDNYRPPYGRRAKDFDRQSVIAGSTNEKKYLHDPTGGRRFWPFVCGKIYLRGIEIERDQLWAEAVQAFKSGVPWYLTDDDIIKLASLEQEERYQEDEWTDPVQLYCKGHEGIGVTTGDILLSLGVETARWDHSSSSRVGTILRRLGWRPKGNERPRRYFLGGVVP